MKKFPVYEQKVFLKKMIKDIQAGGKSTPVAVV
jgi:hypothetical protein